MEEYFKKFDELCRRYEAAYPYASGGRKMREKLVLEIKSDQKPVVHRMRMILWWSWKKEYTLASFESLVIATEETARRVKKILKK
jgi:hypothetical protein